MVIFLPYISVRAISILICAVQLNILHNLYIPSVVLRNRTSHPGKTTHSRQALALSGDNRQK